MNCMKCGRDIEEDQVFCEKCLEVMKQYPVRPGIVIQLPHHKAGAPVRKPLVRRRTEIPLEEQVKRLKKRLLRLRIAFVVVVLLFLGLSALAAYHLITDDHILPGQNYSLIEGFLAEATQEDK